MRFNTGFILMLAGSIILLAACHSNGPTPAYDQDIEATAEAKVTALTTTVGIPTPGPTQTITAPTSTVVMATPTVTSSPEVLKAVCSLDKEAARITCRGSGVPEDSQSQLKWESNISNLEVGPSYEISIYEWVSAVVVTLEWCQGSDCKQAEIYIDTAWVTPEGDKSGANSPALMSTGVRETPIVISSPEGLKAVCSLDEEAARITCRGIGVPEDSQSQLKWESNISDLEVGPSYEISIYEWVSAVVVTLELCQGSECKQVEAYIDTAWVTPGQSESGSAAITTTTETSDSATKVTPVAIESLTCDDNQITALYTTICRAELSGQVDWVNWDFEKGDMGWNRDVDPDDALQDTLVQEEITTINLGDYVIPFKACTGGGDWYPGAKCVEKTVTINVVAGARWANGLPCESDTNPSFERWIIDEGQTKEIWATGTGAHGGTSQHSYVYPRYELEPNGIPVYAPVDGYLWAAKTSLTYSNGVKDYGLNFMVSCEVRIKFGHVVNPIQKIVDLVDSVADEKGHGTWSAKPPLKYVNEQIAPIFFKAGDVLFHHLPNRPGTNQGFDYGLMNTTHVNQFLNPARWEKADTFLHALCPAEYQAEPAKSQIINVLVPYQSTGVTCAGVSREVAGTLSGMWHFADPTAPVMEGHTLRFGGDLVFVEYFNDLIHIGGLNSKELGGVGGPSTGEEFILRLGPGEATYTLPQEVTTSHCYQGSNLEFATHPNNFDFMFLYVEIVDDMTINVVFDSGACPSSFPADYITYVR
jgi:hypothetical protein